MENRLSSLDLASGRMYLLPSASFPAFSCTSNFGASYIAPELYPVHRDADIRAMPAHMGQCYHPVFQGMQYHSTNEDKPTQSYIGLIGKAILSSPQQKLVLSDIYNYILTHYPYFRNKGPGWRNSIRHNLSLNDCFVKLGRSPNGKGHFWAINPINYDDFSRGDYKRKRVPRTNREAPSMVECSKKKALKNENEMKTNKDTSSCSVSEMSCDTVFSSNGTEKRSFYIEALLSNRWEDVNMSDRRTTTSAFTIVPQGLLSATQNTIVK